MSKWIATSILLMAHVAFASVTQSTWGEVHGTPTHKFVLKDGDMSVSLTDYGARIISVLAPDREGKLADVVLGYKDVSQYVADETSFMGSTIGRYGNRIAGGRFTLEGHTYQVPLNNGKSALHGGPGGFFSKVWDARIVKHGVEFTLVSPDGDMGFPGTLQVHVLYELTGKTLKISYSATTTKITVIALTNHAYFNLAGEASGTVLGQKLRINADRFTPVNPELIPTGKIEPVANTPFDFTKFATIGSRIHGTNAQLLNASGYDHNFVLKGAGAAAEAIDPREWPHAYGDNDRAGVQFYSGNFLDGTFTGIGGFAYTKYAGFCLETQHFPNSPNEPTFPSTVLKPGTVLHSTTFYTFGIDGER